jgi:hypothetical protein
LSERANPNSQTPSQRFCYNPMTAGVIGIHHKPWRSRPDAFFSSL